MTPSLGIACFQHSATFVCVCVCVCVLACVFSRASLRWWVSSWVSFTTAKGVLSKRGMPVLFRGDLLTCHLRTELLASFWVCHLLYTPTRQRTSLLSQNQLGIQTSHWDLLHRCEFGCVILGNPPVYMYIVYIYTQYIYIYICIYFYKYMAALPLNMSQHNQNIDAQICGWGGLRLRRLRRVAGGEQLR